MGKPLEPLHGGETGRKRVSDVAELKYDIVNTLLRILEPDCAFKYNTRRSNVINDIRNILHILVEPEVTSKINKLSEPIHNLYTRSTSSPRPGPLFIQTTFILLCVEVTGFV